MMQGSIRRTPRDRVEARSDVRLPTAWIGSGAAPAPWTDGPWLTRTPPRLAGGADVPVLVLLGAEDRDARAELLTRAGGGARVYALVGSGWGGEGADAQVLQAPHVLVRRVPEVPASGVQVGTGGWLAVGGGFVLRLDGSQAEALRLAFLRLFWHEAAEEAWSGGRQFAWRPARERPFDVPEAPVSAAVRLEPPGARLTGDPAGALLHLAGGAPPDATPRRLWYPAGGEHHERLARLASAGAEVVWADRNLPDLHIGSEGGEALLPGVRGRLRLRLTNDQASDVRRLLEAAPGWRFAGNVRLGDAGHRSASFWLAGAAAARGLEAEQLVEVSDVSATSLRGMPEVAPATLPAAQPLALAVRYRWTVVPPRVPAGAEEDALVGRWRKLDEEWTSRLARVRETLGAADAERGRIGRAFSRLVGALLGFERTHAGLLARVATLEAQSPSGAGPSKAPALLAQLTEVEDAARKLQADLEESERKAREEEEREKQQAAWQGRVDAAKRDLPIRRTELATTEARRTTIADELKGVDEAMRAADKDARKDLSASQRKLSDDLQRANKDVTRLRGEVAALEQQSVEKFEFRPPSPPPGRSAPAGGRFVPPASTTRPATGVPEEALPEVGALRSWKGQRYLVIQTWEQLAAGEQAASRLSARLVAPDDA